MGDNELLELSAKAYGCKGLEYRNGSDSFYYDDPELGRECWCPIDDDGQAFRLMVALKLDVNVGTEKTRAVSKPIESGVKFTVDHFGDSRLSTRIAIVRAAAEIGKTK